MLDEIIQYFESIDPVLAAFYASLFTWILTALGASLVFFLKKMNRGLLDGMLGFTGGVMVAASFWSLLAPGIEMSSGDGFVKVIPAAVGFGLGALFLYGLDKVLPHLHINFKELDKRLPNQSCVRCEPRLKDILLCKSPTELGPILKSCYMDFFHLMGKVLF